MSKADLITPEGEQTLKDELDYLWRTERPKVTQQVKDAAALGDRSENAEYIYGKKRLREIDRRVRFLSKRLEKLTVVRDKPADQTKVFFSAWIQIENEQGQVHIYRIVGPDEIDHRPEYISINSPVAKALLGKQAGDDVAVQTPKGLSELYLDKVSYSSFSEGC
ncbi:transcription elongation factor GreB [Bermanella marisrubri]|uniref:Transcription elongation factor GreB n=1 Tax=Bermanella marisrubri TaxID=207949 RepID=Q1N673_9GAMM|nr:transcription elongation factor GreB [Bermanella marisrubri]EAT13719.1 transcription elongation factor GreB [Oceanobacter sp. RED65] [Bermanella marisrubri]QIZ84495.1 transcription elongation factor GreB [Bermanella marisrubri]